MSMCPKKILQERLAYEEQCKKTEIVAKKAMITLIAKKVNEEFFAAKTLKKKN